MKKRHMNKHSWVWLSSFRTTSVLKVGYAGVVAAPLLSYIIEFVNDLGLQTIDQFGAPTKVNLVLPEPLFWLFAGSIFLSFAHFLNETLCPQLIRSYGDIDKYLTNIASLIKNQKIVIAENKLREQRIAESELIENKFPGLPLNQKRLLAEEIAEAINASLIENNPSEEPLLNYRNEWNSENESKWFARLVILTLYAISMLIAVILLFRQLWLVFNAAFPDISLPSLF